MNEYENRAKRIKLEISKAKTIAEEMETDNETKKKSNFSSISPSNGAIVRGGTGNAKGDIKKLVIKNFKSKFHSILRSLVAGLTMRENAQ